MMKLIAIANVVAWSGFWAFGYLALTGGEGGRLTALLLAAIGAGAGIFCYLQLVRHSEATGYAKPRNRVQPEHLREQTEEATV